MGRIRIAKTAGRGPMWERTRRLGALALARTPWRSLGVAAAAGAVAAHPGSARALVYARDALLSGELWRALTGHFVHAGGSHLFWDVAALLAIGVLWERVLGARYWAVFGAAASAVSVGLLLFAPGLSVYAGLSGVLSGLFVAGAMAAARLEQRAGRPWTALLFQGAVIACLLKIGFEAVTGSTIFANIASAGWEPAPLAHALGALGGLFGLWVPPRPSLGAFTSFPRPFGARFPRPFGARFPRPLGARFPRPLGARFPRPFDARPSRSSGARRGTHMPEPELGRS